MEQLGLGICINIEVINGGPSYLIRSQDLLLLFGERGRHEVDDGGDELPTGVQHVSRRDKIKLI
jgi:hypothetical protein